MAKQEREGLRFEYLEAEHFKNISKRIVEIGGRSLLITGPNGGGKSSIIQALLSGINPKIQATDPIQKGEKKGSTKVVFAGMINGQHETYTLEMFYTPANKKGRIVLTGADGEDIKSPKEKLKSIIGNISFDIFKFLKDSKPDQIKVLKELSGVRVDIDKLDMQRKKIFDERTFLTRKTDEDEAVMNNHGMTPEDIDLYSQTKDIELLQRDMDSVSKKLTDWNGVVAKTAEYKKEFEVDLPEKAADINNIMLEKEAKIKELQKELEEKREELIILSEQKAKAHQQYEKGKSWLEKNQEPNAKEISANLSAALLHNQKCEKVTELAEKQKVLRENKQKLEKMNKDIEAIDAQKDKLLKNSKLPIEGLTFTEDNVFMDGLPLEEGQINTAKLIDVGLEVSMALNPNLRVVFLHEGSLFDKESLAHLTKRVEERGYQLIAEIVTDDTEVDIKFVEEEI